MSARCWNRRNRFKYLRPYLNYLNRHPDRVLVLDSMSVMSQGTYSKNPKDLNLVYWGTYRRADVYST